MAVKSRKRKNVHTSCRCLRVTSKCSLLLVTNCTRQSQRSDGWVSWRTAAVLGYWAKSDELGGCI